MMKWLKLIAVAVFMTSALSACNTFHGFGEDVQHLGGAISHAAN
ncbi:MULTISPECIES: entericidin A/B family lipoprotein [Erwinia]|nr:MULTISPECIES: entericidin A/B family lipoprotein [Erwinia]MCX0501588.1 entericidin, EcnA/B family [Erwinia billingiae]QBR50182.1 entericidin A/B family lipoprotein [Erwinia sp. QL-Z3]QEW33857.1 entericidin, EcnA/B family [Erwinia billingiae]